MTNATDILPDSVISLIENNNGEIKRFDYYPSQFGDYICDVDFRSFKLRLTRDRYVINIAAGQTFDQLYSIEYFSEYIEHNPMTGDWSSKEHEDKVLDYLKKHFDKIKRTAADNHTMQGVVRISTHRQEESLIRLMKEYPNSFE